MQIVVSQYFSVNLRLRQRYIFFFVFLMRNWFNFLGNFSYPMPRMLITFTILFTFCECFMKRFQIADASEQEV